MRKSKRLTSFKIIAPSISFSLLVVIFFGCQREGKIERSPDLGKIGPDFSLYDLEGRKLSLSNYRGKVVLLRFWADWCPFCRVEMPLIEHFYRALKDQGLEVLAVNVRQPPEVAEAFSGELGLTYTIPLDPDGDVAKKYRVLGLPTTFIIDEKGIIQEIILGETDEKMIRESLAPYFKDINKLLSLF